MKAIAGAMIAACAFVCAVAAATPLQDCAPSNAPTACLDAKLKAANKQLNSTLKAAQDRLEQLQARGKRPVLGAFIDSQRKFNAYRDAQCNWQGIRAPAGANSADYVKDCQIRATMAREQELAEFLSGDDAQVPADAAASPATERELPTAKNTEPPEAADRPGAAEPPLAQAPDAQPEKSGAATDSSVAAARSNEWHLVKWIVNGSEKSVVPESRVTIAFDPSGKLSGNATINRYSGSYRFDADGHLKWPPAGFAVTRMAGPPALMAQERSFLESLRRTSLYRTDGQQLILQSTNASVILTFTR